MPTYLEMAQSLCRQIARVYGEIGDEWRDSGREFFDMAQYDSKRLPENLTKGIVPPFALLCFGMAANGKYEKQRRYEKLAESGDAGNLNMASLQSELEEATATLRTLRSSPPEKRFAYDTS